LRRLIKAQISKRNNIKSQRCQELAQPCPLLGMINNRIYLILVTIALKEIKINKRKQLRLLKEDMGKFKIND